MNEIAASIANQLRQERPIEGYPDDGARFQWECDCTAVGIGIFSLLGNSFSERDNFLLACGLANITAEDLPPRTAKPERTDR